MLTALEYNIYGAAKIFSDADPNAQITANVSFDALLVENAVNDFSCHREFFSF